jgi:hypothetical protein
VDESVGKEIVVGIDPDTATTVFDRGRTARGCDRIEAGCAHGDHFFRIARLHRGNGIAGIDWAHKRISAHHLNDVRDLRDIEQCGYAGRDVFAVGGCGREDVGVPPASATTCGAISSAA